MQLSRQGKLFIIEFEGIVLVPYQDQVGVWTIGVGHTASAGGIKPKGHPRIDVPTAIEIFERDVHRYEDAVKAAVKVPLRQHEFDALVSWHFNTGAIGRATLTRLLNKGDRKNAIGQFDDWSKAGGVFNRGLYNRRLMEADLFATGDYAPPFTPLVYDRWPGKPRQVDISRLL